MLARQMRLRRRLTCSAAGRPLCCSRSEEDAANAEASESPLRVHCNRVPPAASWQPSEGCSPAQVFDLQHFRPAPVLKQIWANFAAAIEHGDQQAELMRR